MKRERHLLLLFAALVSLGMVLGLLLTPEKGPPRVELPVPADPGLNGTQEIRPQQVSNRTWKPVLCERLFELGTLPHTLLGDPIDVRTDSAGNIYVLDWSNRCVQEYTPDGVLLRTFGGVSGRGPGEFSNPTALDVTKDGEVWVCDPVNGFITVFAHDGSVQRTIRTERPPHRLAVLGEHGFVVISSPAGEFLFHRYTPDGHLVDTCGTVMQEQSRMSVILDGRCAGSDDGRFVYAGYRAGLLGLFNPARTPSLFFAHTLEHPGLPKVLTQQSSEMRYVRVHPDAPLVSRCVSLVGAQVHVLTGILNDDRKSVMDVYDHKTGAYEHSYALPEAVGNVRRTDRMLYTIADTTVTVWRVWDPGLHLVSGH